MDRLTETINDIVYYRKDGELLASVNMSSFDVRNALKRLAEYEDEAEQQEKGCEFCSKKSCLICTNENCIECDNKSDYIPEEYCRFCGRKLV